MPFVSAYKKDRAFRVWILITLFCALFALIYEYFSFGVYSVYMLLMPLCPLLLGALPALLNGRQLGRFWNDGVLLLSAGCLLQGILEIYGTDSSCPLGIMALGGISILLGALFLLWKESRS